MKLYVLQQNGIVKLGITSNENVKIRISQINKNLSEDKKFELVVDFEVNKSPAMIERLIHDYLGINQLNLQYLKNKMVLVDVDYLNSSQTGYTEFFLADKDKIKQAVTLFGILNYINISPDNIKNLDKIKAYSFDFFADKHPEFLKMCEAGIHKNQNADNYIKSTLAEALDNNSQNISCDFIIEKSQYYLLLGDKKVSIEELTQPHNKQHIEDLLLDRNKLKIEHKENHILYSIIREIRENNKETSIQPLASMQKELKQEEFDKFIAESDGFNKIINLVEDFDSGWSLFGYELLGRQSSYLNAHKQLLLENENLSKKDSKKIKQNIKILETDDIFKPNFNSPKIFPELFKLIEEDRIVLESSDYYIMMSESCNMISSIFKIFYHSKDKHKEHKKIETFIDYLDDFCKCIDDKNHITRNEIPFWKLEDYIKSILKNNMHYLELAEAEIKMLGYNTEKKVLNKINKYAKP